MGFPISGDRDCEIVWRVVGVVDQSWRGARTEAILRELVQKHGWPRQGKRLARHLRHLVARGCLRRIAVSRKEVRYEQQRAPFEAIEAVEERRRAIEELLRQANVEGHAYIREDDTIRRKRTFAGFLGSPPMVKDDMAREILRPSAARLLGTLSSLARSSPIRWGRGRPRKVLGMYTAGRRFVGELAAKGVSHHIAIEAGRTRPLTEDELRHFRTLT